MKNWLGIKGENLKNYVSFLLILAVACLAVGIPMSIFCPRESDVLVIGSILCIYGFCCGGGVLIAIISNYLSKRYR